MLHGPAGQGKSEAIGRVLPYLKNITNLPIVKCTDRDAIISFSNQSKRIILVCDDVFKNEKDAELETAFMDLYNNKLQQHSIILSASNVSPSLNIPNFGINNILINRTLPFINEGLPRRLGYSGIINGSKLPQKGLEVFVNNFRYSVATKDTIILFKNLAVFLFIPIILTLIHPIFILSFFSLYFIYTVDYDLELNIESLSKHIIDSYKNYLEVEKDITIEYASCIEPTSCNFIIKAKDYRAVKLSKNVFDMDQHLYFNKRLFDSVNKDWKLWVHPEVGNKLQSNYKRFLVTTQSFDLDTIIAIVKRYANALNEIGIKPHFYAELDDYGRFLFKDNVLYVDWINNQQQTETPEILTIDSQTFVAFKNEMYEIDDILRDNEFFFNKRLNNEDTITLNQFINSTSFLTNLNVLNRTKLIAEESTKIYLATLAKRFKDNLTNFSKHPLAKILLAVILIYSSFKLIALLKAFFTENDKPAHVT